MNNWLPDEPEGWRELQMTALQERDSDKLDALLKRINQLLTKHEQTLEVRRPA